MSVTWSGCDWETLTESDRRRLHTLDAWLRAYLVGGGSPDFSSSAPPEMQAAFDEGRAIANDLPRIEQFHWAEREVIDLRDHYCQ